MDPSKCKGFEDIFLIVNANESLCPFRIWVLVLSIYFREVNLLDVSISDGIGCFDAYTTLLFRDLVIYNTMVAHSLVGFFSKPILVPWTFDMYLVLFVVFNVPLW